MCLPFLITFRLAARGRGAPNLLADWRKVLWVYNFPSERRGLQLFLREPGNDNFLEWWTHSGLGRLDPARWSGTGLWRNSS